ncbi:phosphoribosylformylglycinamidine synthase subunit PurL [Gemmatimonadota bacterium]
MVHRIEVGFADGVTDARGESVTRSVAEDLGIEVAAVRTVEVYTTNVDLSGDQLERLGAELFADPVIQRFSVDKPLHAAGDFDWLLEVGFRPGVTDNVGHSAAQGMRDMLGGRPADGRGVFTGRQYLFTGNLSRDDVERIASGVLANALIERWQIIGREQWQRGIRVKAEVPVVAGGGVPDVAEYNLEVSDAELLKISEDGLLSLSLEEMKAIQAHFRGETVRQRRAELGLGANPTDVELECIAQTWSEHCKHKIFSAAIDYEDGNGGSERIDGLFNSYIRRSTMEIGERVDWLISLFHDNAGVVAFDDEWGLAMKVETHNSPSALDPYGGAITGIVGVNRDILGTGIGCRMIFNTDVFCFARPDYDKPLEGKLLHPKRIFRGVHRGVRDGGNQSGIPTVNGAIVFDDRYRGKPLVFCGTGGMIPRVVAGRPSHEKPICFDDRIVMVGGRIGKDGIHGATFSSLELDESSPASAVQIGDPITQKKMADCLIEARDAGLIRTLTDNGAGGLSSSVGEMAGLAGGAEVDLERAPLKYPGLAPWEILLSEAQERMSVVVSPGNIDAFMELCLKHEVEATDMGRFTSSGMLHVRYAGRTVAALDLEFLHEGLPRMELKARWSEPSSAEPTVPDAGGGLDETLLAMMARYNVCSREAIVRQYDHEVQALTMIKPFCGPRADGPTDAAVIRPVPDSNRGVVVGCGIVPRYSDLDAYSMAACAIDEAVRNVVATGGRPDRIAGLDNFCWPDPVESVKTPDGAFKLAQLVRACRAVYDCCTAWGVPCISGKDSMKNDYGSGESRISIPPTLLFTAVGIIDDVSRAVTSDFKRVGDLIYLVGDTLPELGASEFYSMLQLSGGQVPVVDLERSKLAFDRVHEAISAGLVASCHDLSDGGLAVAVAESCIAGDIGARIAVSSVPGAERFGRDDLLLFSESQGRFLISVRPEKRGEFEQVLGGKLTFGYIGEVISSGRLEIESANMVSGLCVELEVERLRSVWQAPLDW